MDTLIHTSPFEEIVIDNDPYRLFGPRLFFSHNEYVMTQGEYFVHTVTIDPKDILIAENMAYEENFKIALPIVQKVMKLCDCDQDTAVSYLDGSDYFQDEENFEKSAQIGWELQKLACEAAELMGYKGVELVDEQGACYLINMTMIELDKK